MDDHAVFAHRRLLGLAPWTLLACPAPQVVMPPVAPPVAVQVPTQSHAAPPMKPDPPLPAAPADPPLGVDAEVLARVPLGDMLQFFELANGTLFVTSGLRYAILEDASRAPRWQHFPGQAQVIGQDEVVSFGGSWPTAAFAMLVHRPDGEKIRHRTYRWRHDRWQVRPPARDDWFEEIYWWTDTRVLATQYHDDTWWTVPLLHSRPGDRRVPVFPRGSPADHGRGVADRHTLRRGMLRRLRGIRGRTIPPERWRAVIDRPARRRARREHRLRRPASRR